MVHFEKVVRVVVGSPLLDRPEVVSRRRRWGVILAGGDGMRPQSLARSIYGSDRPKQFCRFFGNQSLLQQTQRRAELNIPREQVLFALTLSHREFYLDELGKFQKQRLVQPANKGTAPPILFSALSIERIDKNAQVAMFPSHHHYANEECFRSAVESAFGFADKHPESIVLVGAQADRPEVEYGWIEPASFTREERTELFRVLAFWKKPTLAVARGLLDRGSVWNTSVMVGHVRAFLEVSARAIPDVLETVRHAGLWRGAEAHLDESAYDQLPFCDFSRQVLSLEASRLLAMRVQNLGWNDLGNLSRVLAVLEESGLRPAWMDKWVRMKPRAAVA